MNLVKKIVAITTVLTVLVGPGMAFGLTAEELQTQIDALMVQLAQLQAQLEELTGGEAGACYTGIPDGFTFDTNLSSGVSDPDVVYLKIVLDTEVPDHAAWAGTEYYGPKTVAAVKEFQLKYQAEISAYAGYTISGTGFVGTGTRAQLNHLLSVCVVPEECTTDADCPAGYTCTAGACVAIPVAAGLNVSLAATTPASTTIITTGTTLQQAQVLVPFTTVNFTAGSEGAVKVTNLKFTRNGIASDSNLDNTYLYEGDTKLVEGGTISSKVVTFNDANGIFTVPAGQTKAITLKGNLDSAASAGSTIGFNLVAVGDVTSDASAVNGTFPITGNLMTVANATDLGYVTIAGSYATPGTQTSIDPQDDYVVWSFSLRANNQNLSVERLVFTEVGSVLTEDLQNFNLYYGGTVVGTVASMTADRLVIFDLSASPLAITKGVTKTLQLHADIVKGSTRTFAFTFQYPSDLAVKDMNYGVYVGSYVTLASGWTLVQPTSNYLINSGSLTVTKRTDSPTGNIPLDATGVTLAKYDFKAVGEDVKVSNLRVAADTVRTGATPSTANGLDNGMVYLNGVQVGSTMDINEYATGALAEGTSFTFGSSFIVPAGTTSVVEIKADVKDLSSNSFVATNTILIYLLHDDSYNNAQGVSSLTISDVPSSDKAANTLTVRAGTLTFTKSTAYGNQSTTAPATAMKVGSFQMTAGSTEGVDIDSITVVIENSGEDKIESLLLKIGTEQIGTTKVTPTASNLFSVVVNLPASQSKTVDIYADILSTATSTIDADGFAVSGTGTTTITSTAANATAVELQIITVATSDLTVAAASDNPDDGIIVGLSTGIPMAKYEFASTYEAFTVSQIKVYASSDQDRTAARYAKPNLRDFVNIWLSYQDSTGATVTTGKQSTFVNGMMDFSNLSLYVPANGKAKFTVYADLNAVAATGYALTGDRPEISLAYYKASSGSIASLERRTGIIWYEAGTNDVALTWATTTGDSAANDLLYMQGTRALKFASTASLTGYHGGELDIPVRDLDLLVSDLTSVTWSVQTSDSNLYAPGLSIFVDCDLDGGFDGEIMYVNYAVAVVNEWETETLTQASLVDWWSNANICGAAGSGVALSTFPDTDAKIIGIGFSHGYYAAYITASKNYYADKLVINTSTATYAVEDDMGALGTNYILYKSKPTVSMEGATSGTLVTGQNTLFTTRIAADSAGDIGLKVLTFGITGNDLDAVTHDMLLDTLKFYKGSTDYTDKVAISSAIDGGGTSYEAAADDLADGNLFTVYVTFANEEVITAGTSQIFYLKGTTTATATGDSISTYMIDDANPYGVSSTWDIGLGAAYASLSGEEFVWSDQSYGASHDLTSLDWVNGAFVETLGTANTYTISR